MNVLNTKAQHVNPPLFDVLYAVQSIMHSTTALCVATDATARSLEQMGEWRYTTKDEMKHLGGTLIQTEEKFREFLLLGVSKMIEDTLNHAGELLGRKLSIWDPSLSGLPHSRDVRWIRHVGNVIKHNNSIILVASGSRSCIDLVTQFGAHDDSPISDMPELRLTPLRDTMLRFIYFGLTFSFALLSHHGLWSHQSVQVKDHEIATHMLGRFVHTLPGHPARPNGAN